MRPWDARRELLEEAKPHYVSAIAAVVAAAASAYGASKQASAAKKSKLAAANAALAGGAGGGGTGATVASAVQSIGRDNIGKLPSQARMLDSPEIGGADLPTMPSSTNSLGGMLPLDSQPSPTFPEAPDAPERYSSAMGLSDTGHHEESSKAKGYTDLAASALPLILSLTQGHPPEAAPRPTVAPYSYQPTALSYRQRMGFL